MENEQAKNLTLAINRFSDVLLKNSRFSDDLESSEGRLFLFYNLISCNDRRTIKLCVRFLDEFSHLVEKNELQQYLRIAVTNDNVKVTEVLLKYDANPVGEDWQNVNHIFQSSNRKEILKLLLDHGLGDCNSQGQNLLEQFIEIADKDDQDAVEIAKILINSGISVHYAGFHGMTPLHHSNLRRNLALMSFFIDKGVDVNAKDNSGETVLHDACSAIDAEAVCLLIRSGAEISPVNNDGETPFYKFWKFIIGPYDNCLRVLVKEFAKLSFENVFICQLDMKLIKANPEARAHFEKCLSELEQMTSTKFYRSYTYFFVLTLKNIKKLSLLTKNKEFLTKFEENFQAFSYYGSNLKMIMDKAIQYKNESASVELRLYEIFKDFLPNLVIRKMVDNLRLEDLPLK